MNTKRATKRALLTSVMALVMCVVMLVGTTFAWFTDTASTSVNKIQAGKLDIKLEYKNSTTDNFAEANAKTQVFKENALWEPGYVEYVVLKVSNIGNLALKYKLGINIAGETGSTNVSGSAFKLSDYIKFAVIDEDKSDLSRDKLVAAAENSSNLINAGYTAESHLVPADKVAAGSGVSSKTVTLVVWMPSTVGNEANRALNAVAPTINLGITVVATQDTVEKDSKDNQYDKDAVYPIVSVNTADGFKEALANTSIETIILSGNMELGENITVDRDVTIDLNGKKLTKTGADKAAVEVTNGTLTLAGDGEVTGATCVKVTGGGKAVIESGTYTATSGYAVYADGTGVNLTISGGTFSSSENYAICVANGATAKLTGSGASSYSSVLAKDGGKITLG